MNNILFKEIWIKASVEAVFNYFTKTEAMLSWHGKEIELNPVPGGIYRVVFEDGTVILGEYKKVEPNKRIVYTANYESVESLITIDFIAENEGTRIKLKQEFAPGQDTLSFDSGWDYFLNILKELLSSEA